MSEQQSTMLLDALDSETKQAKLMDAESRQRKMWKICWDWDGPIVGGYCQIDGCFADLESGETIYAAGVRCKFIEQRADGKWIATLDLPKCDGKPWSNHGKRVILETLNIWFDVYGERQQGDLTNDR